MGGRPVLAAGLVAAALVVGGCSSGAQGAPGPDAATQPSTTSSAVSSTPSTSESATLDAVALARIPKAARAHTPQGAEAFARFYLEQVNKAWMAPDPELIRPYALESCKTCANFVETTIWLRDEQLHYERPPTEIGPSGWLPESTKDHAFVQVVNNQQQSRILKADGSVEDSVDKTPALDEVELRWENGVWLLAAIRIASK
jgi:hypothetical protein